MTFSFSEVVRVAYQSHVVGLLTPQTGYLLRGKDTRSNCVIAFPSTLNPPVSDHPKCEDSAGRWSLVRIEPQYTSSKGVLTLLLLLHTTYQLCAVRFLLLRGTIHTDLNIERTIKTVIATSGDGHACNRGVVVNYRALTRKNLVFLICGRLREVKSYEKWSYWEFKVNSNVKNEDKRGAFCGRSTLRTRYHESRPEFQDRNESSA